MNIESSVAPIATSIREQTGEVRFVRASATLALQAASRSKYIHAVAAERADDGPLEMRFVDQRMFGGLLVSDGGAASSISGGSNGAPRPSRLLSAA